MNRRDLIAAGLCLAGAAAPSRASETGPDRPWYLQDYVDAVWHLAIAFAGPFIDTIYVVRHHPDLRTIYLGFGGGFVATVGTYTADDAAAIAGELSRRHVYPVVELHQLGIEVVIPAGRS